MPDELLNRAEEILQNYENRAKNKGVATKVQLKMDFGDEAKSSENSLKNKLKDIDVLKTTPMEALNMLYDLSEEAKK